jgi:hypothetical protein
MKAARLFLLIFLVILMASSLVHQRPSLSRAQTGQSGQPDETAPREIDFPYYSFRDGFSSTVLLVSSSVKPLDFVMAIHSRSGQTLLAPTMTIQPRAKLTVDLRALLTSLSADLTGEFGEGSISIYFNGAVMPLLGQLTTSNPARSLIFESDVVDNSPGVGLLPPALNAVWWGLGSGREARVSVSNTSGEPVTADLFLDFQNERHSADPLAFAPHETKVVSVTQLLGGLKVSPAQAPEGGITIIQRGPRPSLIAQGRITDSATGFSTTLNFPDPSAQWASALHASGVPIGMPSKDSPYAGTGVFIPHVVVRNLTGAPQSVKVTVEYPGEKETQRVDLVPLALESYSTSDLALDSAFGLLPLPLPFCSIRVQYSGPPGSVIGEISSIEQKNDMVIDSRMRNEGDGWAGSGGHPWHLDEETESILFLTNMSDQEARIGFQVSAGGVVYHITDLKLMPHETRAIDLRKLRDAQKPDFLGNKIPANATDGSALWGRIDNVPVMGRLVVLQRRKALASSYSCDPCSCPMSLTSYPLQLTPSPVNVTPQQALQVHASAQYVQCGTNYYWYDETIAGTMNWSSDNPGVATVNNLAAKGLVTGVSGGTTTIRATYQDYAYSPSYGCPCNSWQVIDLGSDTANVKPSVTSMSPTRGLIGVTTSVTINGKGFGTNPTVNAGSGVTVTRGSFTDTQVQASFAVASNAPSGNHSVTVTTAQGTSNSVNFYVQVPYSATFISQISAAALTQAQCASLGGPAGSAGYERWVTLELRDSAGQSIQRSGVTVADQLTPSTPNALGIGSGTTGSAGTDSAGRWPDHYYVCSTACPASTGQSNVNQSWTANATQLGHVNLVIYKCNSITVDGY